MNFNGTFGVHFLPHHSGWERLTARQLVEMGEVADDGDVECIWFATRFLSRDALTLMSMMSSRVNTSLGTLVANPWGRNPLELAGALGTIAEMVPVDREVRFGIGSGVSHGRWVARPKPLRVVRETIEIVRALLSGETVSTDEFTVADYFHLDGPARLSVEFSRPEAVSFWFALTGGPLGDKLAAEVADGVLIDAGTVMGLSSLSDGRADGYVAAIDARRAAVDGARPLRKCLNLCVSVSEDRAAAFDRARAHADVAAGRGIGQARGLPTELTDGDLSEMFLVGTPEAVVETLVDCIPHAARIGCEHVVLGVPTGPRPAEAIELISHVVVPAVRRRLGPSSPAQQPGRRR
jgi:5,10-methylenetetrahydromethanopterin reductase